MSQDEGWRNVARAFLCTCITVNQLPLPLSFQDMKSMDSLSQWPPVRLFFFYMFTGIGQCHTHVLYFFWVSMVTVRIYMPMN